MPPSGKPLGSRGSRHRPWIDSPEALEHRFQPTPAARFVLACSIAFALFLGAGQTLVNEGLLRRPPLRADPLDGRAMLIVALLGTVYFLPSAIASAREHRRGKSIFALNLLLGWTVVGWGAALIWCFRVKSRDAADR